MVMGIQKLTFFELHFDGATFGPVGSSSESPTDEETLVGDETDAEREGMETGSSGGILRKLALAVGVSIAVSLIATAIAKRFAGDDDEDFDTVDLAADTGSETEEAIDVVEE